jgi:hypothetical protein
VRIASGLAQAVKLANTSKQVISRLIAIALKLR